MKQFNYNPYLTKEKPPDLKASLDISLQRSTISRSPSCIMTRSNNIETMKKSEIIITSQEMRS